MGDTRIDQKPTASEIENGLEMCGGGILRNESATREDGDVESGC